GYGGGYGGYPFHHHHHRDSQYI
ncbi:spore coat protein, partial [Bacillus velezensis]|nr:spore coat protein [Bacillus velezensis]